MPTIVSCVDIMLRRIGGVPTDALTDNEKTVTVEHIARIAVRNREIVEVGRHDGMTIGTCLPADPQSMGGSEDSVRIAKADLMPTTATLLEEYRTVGKLEDRVPGVLRRGKRPALPRDLSAPAASGRRWPRRSS